MSTSVSAPERAAHLRGRVRLYLSVLLVIDLYAYIEDVLGPALFDSPPAPEMSPWASALRHGVSVALVAGWLIARFSGARRPVMIGFEIVVTLGLSVFYSVIGPAYLDAALPAYGPVAALLGVLLLLVTRAALVPSTAPRTAAVGVGALVIWRLLNHEELEALADLASPVLSFMGAAFVVATVVTSRVIYGLQRQVRDAMRLGQYELTRKIGAGAMGEVYEATHRLLRRPTAVKLLPMDAAAEEAIARFEREVVQTSRLEHPNSVRIYDYGRTPDGQFYYAMELIDGVTLEELVRLDGPIGAARVATILTQAARALAEAHALGLIHRDIKPANIMLTDRAGIADTVKVLDFGLVLAVDDPDGDALVTHADAIVGTPHYLSPEAITSPDDVGTATDVYALGAVGFFLLTGRHVFEGRTVIEVCSQHLKDAPEAPSAVLGAPVHAELEALVLRCLAKDPARRPADGAALARALERLALDGWTEADARDWWDCLGARRPDEERASASGRTQLRVNLADRE